MTIIALPLLRMCSGLVARRRRVLDLALAPFDGGAAASK
jgi:hypothetical protein